MQCKKQLLLRELQESHKQIVYKLGFYILKHVVHKAIFCLKTQILAFM
jgi:hypothetical protein